MKIILIIKLYRLYKHDANGAFFFQAEDGIRDYKVTGVQTCALPIWAVQRHCRTYRPRAEDRADRVGPEPVQFRRSRMGQCCGLLRAQWDRIHPVVPAGSRARGWQAAGEDCKGSPSKTYPDRVGVVAETVPDYAAHPRNFLDCAS